MSSPYPRTYAIGRGCGRHRIGSMVGYMSNEPMHWVGERDVVGGRVAP
ncbi:hypothetical protein Rrhod_2670 [Rhodococcus rhodnii LMG 5362]|uniref:Uncharacterized protein n=1 Tax=Rhodococcus rhodnii LMG 5362 TaxID=1273125 RepID=R7WL45_9NOCA|nr:hypothetical protein Rrhod_2670 [Rhodococcus rhodnii LMG 5362]